MAGKVQTQRLDPSKENARQALKYLKTWRVSGKARAFVAEFLEAAERKLPRQETLERGRRKAG